MKQAIKKLMPILLVVVICISLAACSSQGINGSNSNDPIAVSLVIGTHKYFPSISLSSKKIYNELYAMAYSYGDCSVIVVDGDPYLSGNYSVEKPDKSIDDAKRRQIAKQNTAQIILESQQAVAKTEEFDTLTAITKSAGCLRSVDYNQLNMLIYDSGFSTTGLLNFAASNMIDSDVDMLVEQLEELHAIPDLSGINILWVGLGEVCGEQSKLTSEYKYKLKNIWSSIIAAGGGVVSFDESAISPDTSENHLPDVSIVPVIEKALNVEEVLAVDNTLSQPIKFDNETVKFVGDSDEFIDKSAAISALTPIAEYLKANTSVSITIAGTTASAGSEQGCINLSLKRAIACKALLLEMGVADSQITCAGLGRSQNCFRVNDLDSNGNLVEPYASQNRAVFIFDSTSDFLKDSN